MWVYQRSKWNQLKKMIDHNSQFMMENVLLNIYCLQRGWNRGLNGDSAFLEYVQVGHV